MIGQAAIVQALQRRTFAVNLAIHQAEGSLPCDVVVAALGCPLSLLTRRLVIHLDVGCLMFWDQLLQHAEHARHVGVLGQKLPVWIDQEQIGRGQGVLPRQVALAAMYGNEPAVALLLDRGANPNLSDPMGRAALHLAVVSQHTEIVRLLVSHGADVNQQQPPARRRCMWRRGSHLRKWWQCLLDCGACPNARTAKGDTPLDIAACSGCL